MKLIAIILVNILTTVRVIGTICLVPIYHYYGGVAAAILSITCYFTDCLDGIIARKCHVATFFGSVFDGVADKMFSCANLIVLLTMTGYAIFPILCEVLIITIQTIRYHHNENVQSSKAGKLKTWVISLTVICLYLILDIQNITFLSTDFINTVVNNRDKLLFWLFVPLYIAEIITVISYIIVSKVNEPKKEVNLPPVDIKLKENA